MPHTLLIHPDKNRICVHWEDDFDVCLVSQAVCKMARGAVGTDAATYTVRLSIQVEDRKGILADVSSKIAGINTNIRNVEATVDSQMGRIDMTVEISDVKHLQKVIKSLKSVAGVVDVERAAR